MSVLLMLSAMSVAQVVVHVPRADFDRRVESGQISMSGGGLVRSGTRLAPFTAKDLNGAEWTEARLRGKTTLISVWASWCKPCVEELPVIARLHRAASELSGVQVITFNMDEPGASKLPAVESGLPVVLVGDQYIKKFVEFDKVSLPKFWLVNKDGVLVRESQGRITGDPDKWIEEQLTQLRR